MGRQSSVGFDLCPPPAAVTARATVFLENSNQLSAFVQREPVHEVRDIAIEQREFLVSEPILHLPQLARACLADIRIDVVEVQTRKRVTHGAVVHRVTAKDL